MNLRKRVDHFRDESQRAYYWRGKVTPPQPYPGVTSHEDYELSASATQELLLSEGHPIGRLGKVKRDIGGPFLCVRRLYEEASTPRRHYRDTDDDAAQGYNYLGSYHAESAVVTDDNFPEPIIPDASEMLAHGATAIARCIPTNPLNGLLTTLGEIRAEGLPSVMGSTTWQSRSLSARNAGGEYLNYEFGWRPLVNEVRGLCNTVRRADELLKQYERDAGRVIRRAYEFPVESSHEEQVLPAWPDPAYVVTFWPERGVKTTTTRIKTREWFEGAFTYHIPQGLMGGGFSAKANHLYGTRLTPEVLWNLTPWSWAVDWFTNLGDIIHNVSAFLNDGLAMPYAYIMRERIVEKRVVLTGAVTTSHGELEPLEQVFTTVVKARLGATPFGFGLDPVDLSDRQKAIIVALGLSQGSNSSGRFD